MESTLSYRLKSVLLGGFFLVLAGAYLFFTQPSWRISAISLALGAYMALIGALNFLEMQKQGERYGVSSLVAGSRKNKKKEFKEVAIKFVPGFLALGVVLSFLSDPEQETILFLALCLALVAFVLGTYLDRRAKSAS